MSVAATSNPTVTNLISVAPSTPARAAKHVWSGNTTRPNPNEKQQEACNKGQLSQGWASSLPDHCYERGSHSSNRGVSEHNACVDAGKMNVIVVFEIDPHSQSYLSETIPRAGGFRSESETTLILPTNCPNNRLHLHRRISIRRIRYCVAISLDGYIAGSCDECEWIVIDSDIHFGKISEQFDTYLIWASDVRGSRLWAYSDA